MNRGKKLKIVVGGYIVGLPAAGMTWHHLHYLLGLHRLGHEVFFLEDSGEWSVPYDPSRQVLDPNPAYGIDYLQRCFDAVGLPIEWCYVSRLLREGRPSYFGSTKRRLFEALEQADLCIAVSGVTPFDDDRPQPVRTLGIDTDPVYTQLRMLREPIFADYWKRFDRLASFGTLLGTTDCHVPTHGLRWHPTRQPVVLDQWQVTPPPPPAKGPMTTIGRWEHDSDRHVEFEGQSFRSSKRPGWMAVQELPMRVNVPMRLAMASVPNDERQRFEASGWAFDDPEAVSRDLSAYGEFIANSLGEFTPAKQIYADLPSGWFSDRAACYLAAGRPVVTQATGFERGPLALPVGEGLLTWSTLDEATMAVRAVGEAPAHHAAAARAIAETHLASDTILPELIDLALA